MRRPVPVPLTTTPAPTQPAGRPPSRPPARPSAPSRPSVAAQFRETSYPPSATGRPWVHFVEGDVLDLPSHVGAIVNAAHNQILGGGGVSGAIQARARENGRDDMERDIRAIQRQYPNGVPTGDAVVTSAPNINADVVIHAVPPDFSVEGDSPSTRALLTAAYRNALDEADELGLRSVAFPILAGQIFRGSLRMEEVEQIALDALRGASSSVQNVYLVRYRQGARGPLPDHRSPAGPPAPAAVPTQAEAAPVPVPRRSP
jgi:O-acetyl-ADP-ribose deacetylase